MKRRSYRKSDHSERFVARLEVKAKDESRRTFEGDLSTSHLDLGDWEAKDIVHPGAFARWINSFKSATEPYVPLLNSHDRWDFFSVLGHLTDAEEKLTGQTLEYELEGGRTLKVDEMRLRTEWQVIDGEDGARVMDRIRPGSGRKMSMGYEPLDFDFGTLEDGSKLRNLREVKVEEGSLVVFAMNPEAEVSTVKAMLQELSEIGLDEEGRESLKALQRELARILDTGQPGPEKVDPARLSDLEGKIGALMLDRLDTRIDAVRHSVGA